MIKKSGTLILIELLNYQKWLYDSGIIKWIRLIEFQEKRRNEELLNELSKELL